MAKVKFDFSAGGVLVEENKVLLIKVENLKGEIVWTFPKGHIEKGEKPEEAAIREVEEETGYLADIISSIDRTTYWFIDKDGNKVKKTVWWFLMKPKTKVKEPKEVLEIKWFPIESAKNLLSYKSDKELILPKAEKLAHNGRICEIR